MSMLGTEFIQRLDQYFPPALAESDDPVGLHIGTLNKQISKVMMTLDVRPEVVAEAVREEVDLIVAKHPPIFRPIKRLTVDDPQNKMYSELIKHDIAVYAIHTNMDIVEDGLNDWFCELLKIGETDFLKVTHEVPYLKLSVTVPTDHAESVRGALEKAGAGQQGDYCGCSFSMAGEGRFTPVGNAEPYLGSLNQGEVVAETKIEVMLLETQRHQIVKAMLAAHPYEEPAYDLIYLANPPKQFGIGRIGDLEEALTLVEFVQQVKEVFQLEGLRLISDNPDKLVKRVAICGGSGEKFFRDAVKANADVYITGDVYYHTAHDMIAEGISVIDPGHHIEVLCQERCLTLFEQWKQENNWNITFIESKEDTNPFRYY